MPEGLLYVLAQEPVGLTAEFHDWYDTEHAPARLTVPGIRSAHRYRAVDDTRPGWLAWYELDDAGVLDTPAYQRLRDRRSDRERSVVARLETLERRVYELLDAHGTAPEPAPVLIARSMTVPPDHEADFHDWYTREHVPALRAIPGWRRIRRYVLRAGDAPRFLTLHEISGTDLCDTDAYRAATRTPWRERIMRSVTATDRRVFAHHRTFPPG